MDFFCFRRVIVKLRPDAEHDLDYRRRAQRLLRFHDAGFAHSIEAWLNGKLAAALYAWLSPARESMFHLVPEASRGSLNAL